MSFTTVVEVLAIPYDTVAPRLPWSWLPCYHNEGRRGSKRSGSALEVSVCRSGAVDAKLEGGSTCTTAGVLSTIEVIVGCRGLLIFTLMGTPTRDPFWVK